MKTYTVELDNYSGPLDVLLRLIQRQKLDICDINLAIVTNDYLQFMKNTTLDQHSANQFLEVAVKLILYKSKALLPSQDAEQSEEEIEDLAEQLRILSLFQQSTKKLIDMQKNAFILRPMPKKLSKEIGFYNLSLDNLVDSYRQISKNLRTVPKKTFHLKRQSNKQLQEKLLSKLEKISKIEISKLNTLAQTKQEVVILFMMILNLLSTDKANLSTNNNNYKIEIIK